MWRGRDVTPSAPLQPQLHERASWWAAGDITRSVMEEASGDPGSLCPEAWPRCRSASRLVCVRCAATGRGQCPWRHRGQWSRTGCTITTQSSPGSASRLRGHARGRMRTNTRGWVGPRTWPSSGPLRSLVSLWRGVTEASFTMILTGERETYEAIWGTLTFTDHRNNCQCFVSLFNRRLISFKCIKCGQKLERYISLFPLLTISSQLSF